MDAVLAAGVERGRSASGNGSSGPALVVHVIGVAVLDHREPVTGVAFPGTIQLQDRFGRLRVVKLQARPYQALEEQVIHEELPPAADVGDRRGVLGKNWTG